MKWWFKERWIALLLKLGFERCQQCGVYSHAWCVVDEAEGRSVLCPKCAKELPW